ncbi:MAG: hypothetical protein Q9196_003687, partial [Gyalolechia fulgens]
ELDSPPTIAVTQHGDDDDTDSSDDGIVTMQIPKKHIPNPNPAAPPASDPPRQGSGPGALESLDPYGPDAGGGGSSSDDDLETEEMRFGGEGLEGFVHSPRAIAEGPTDEDVGLVMGRQEGHEEDLGRKPTGA